MSGQSVVTDVLPEHLKLVKGRNYEGVVDLLTQREVPFQDSWNYPTFGPPLHFRASSFNINQFYREVVHGILGKPGWQSRLSGNKTQVDCYRALYKIEPEFDHSILDGKFTFDAGRLVELVRVEYVV